MAVSSSSSTHSAASTSETTPLLPPAVTAVPNALVNTIKFITRGLVYTAKYSSSAYIGSKITLSPHYAVLRTGRRDRYVLLQSSIDFPIFHAPGQGLPPGFKVYRMRKGWRAGILGWHGGFQKRNWEDVTPQVELKVNSGGGRGGAKVEYSSGSESIVPAKAFVKEVATVDLNEAAAEEGQSNASTRHFTAVTHVSVHVPLDRTPDGFYKFVITDANDKVLIMTPEYTIHSSFTSFGILRGSSLPALPIQFIGFLVKNAIAGVVSTALTALYFTGGLPGGVAVRLFMWFYKKQVDDAKEKAYAFVKEKGAVKPLDYLARGAGGALPGSHNRFVEYEKEWDGKKGSWVVRDVERGRFK